MLRSLFFCLCLLASPAPAAECPKALSSAASWAKSHPWRAAAAGMLLAAASYGSVETVSTDRVAYHLDAVEKYEPSLQVALLGDSMSTDFHYSTPLPTLFDLRTTRIGGWFVDRPSNPAQSFTERCAQTGSVDAACFARAGASVLSSPDASVGKKLGQIDHLPDQVRALTRLQSAPDLVLVWIGHNDADFAYTCSKHPELDAQSYCAQLPAALRAAMLPQLRVVGNNAAKRGEAKSAVVVFGLLDFDSAIAVRKKVSEEHSADRTRYPYLEAGIDGFPTLAPQNQKLATELVGKINADWRSMVDALNVEFAGKPVRFFFSDAFSSAELEQADISDFDGLHLSPAGHARFAERAHTELAPVLHYLRHR